MIGRFLAEFILASTIIGIVYAFYIPAFFPMDRSGGIGNNGIYAKPSKESVNIIRGIMPMNTNKIEISTYDPLAANFIWLPRPIDGFTYSFWMNRGTVSFNGSSNSSRVIFMRGLPMNNTGNTSTSYMCKCPLIRFGADVNELVVEYNTVDSVSNSFNINPDIMKSFSNTWMLYTFVFRDNIDNQGCIDKTRGVKTGSRIDFYMDNKLVASHVNDDSALKLNQGPVVLLPGSPTGSNTIASGQLSDLRYMNHAMTANEIDSAFRRGFSRNTYVTPKTLKVATMKNKIDKISIYNETEQI